MSALHFPIPTAQPDSGGRLWWFQTAASVKIGNCSWVVMITSAENRRWPDDVDLTGNYRAVGLPAPSLIRPSKIATIELADAEWLGEVSRAQLQQVVVVLGRQLALR